MELIRKIKNSPRQKFLDNHRSLARKPDQGLPKIAAIASRSDGCYALEQDGSVWAWGGLFGGDLGNNTAKGSAVPIRIPGLTNVKNIVSADYNSYALKADGSVWAWGGNPTGQLGNGSAGLP